MALYSLNAQEDTIDGRVMLSGPPFIRRCDDSGETMIQDPQVQVSTILTVFAYPFCVGMVLLCRTLLGADMSLGTLNPLSALIRHSPHCKPPNFITLWSSLRE